MLTLSRLPFCRCDVRRRMSDKLALTSRMRRENSSVDQHVPTISFRHCDLLMILAAGQQLMRSMLQVVRGMLQLQLRLLLGTSWA